jgi:hypothetical protein
VCVPFSSLLCPGGVGSLTHALLLQGEDYIVSFEVMCDGLYMSLEDPYSSCPRVRVRKGHEDHDVVIKFPADDPYKTEDDVRVYMDGRPFDTLTDFPESREEQSTCPHSFSLL